jgi:hypothetical protein
MITDSRADNGIFIHTQPYPFKYAHGNNSTALAMTLPVNNISYVMHISCYTCQFSRTFFIAQF